MHYICSKYAVNMHKICHYIDFNIANMQNICTKYAKYVYIYMHKMCIQYA